ncbi:MAG: thiamine phosphate synthase [Alphaproteobacteria bacterium]|jgi:thiamine-phosphate pyrophosphorylase|nr:thiamine phosphate synthase [Alphaproteobacteria bacterium]HJP22889.1 thiamine phosphate synthase [Alphaproteobacteria bacterium]
MTLAKLARHLNSAAPPGLPPLILLSDPARFGDPRPAAARLPRGAALVLRHYGLPGREALARDLVALCRPRGVRLLIAADGALAARVGAAGLHLPEGLAAAAGHWRRAHPGWLVTAAAHSLPALHKAARAGAEAALLSPLFVTASHPERPSLGIVRFAAMTRAAALPVYALGGIAAGNAPRLRGSGAVGIAAIAGILAELGLKSRK